LRDFTGIDMVAVDEICEELPDAADDTPAPQKRAAQADGELVCSDCRAEITNGVCKYSVQKHGRPLCFGCQRKVKGQEKASK